MKRGPGRPRKNPQKDSPVPAAAPKSATKAVENSKKVVGSARRKSAPPTKMLVKTEPSIDTHVSRIVRFLESTFVNFYALGRKRGAFICSKTCC